MAKKGKGSKSKKSYPALIALFTVAVIAGYLGYSLLMSGFISKSDLTEFTGTLKDKGEYEETSLPIRDPETGVRERTVTKYYQIKLNNLNQNLRYYNSKEKYSELDKAIQTDDELTVSYSTRSGDIYEIKKGDQIILDGNDKRLRNKIGGFILVIGALLIFGYVFNLSRK